MTHPTPEDVARLLEGATAGPWHTWSRGIIYIAAEDRTVIAAIEPDPSAMSAPHGANGDLLAAAPSIARAYVALAERVREMERIGSDLIAQASDYYTARNGKLCSIEGDDGEKCWIVPFDPFEELRAALTAGGAPRGVIEGGFDWRPLNECDDADPLSAGAK